MSDLENFSFVLPKELAGMAYPHAPRAIDEVRDLGFRSVVSLSRRTPPLDALRALVHLHCPLADFTRIPPIDLHRVVAFLRNAPQPIVVHGEGGIGRTGVVLACRLVTLGRTASKAVAEVRRARPGSIDDTELEASVEEYERFFQSAGERAAASPFNFAPASPLDRIVHGAERPGFGMASWSSSVIRSRVSNAPGSSPPDLLETPVENWLAFMARQGMREVVCLLDEADMASYRNPLLTRYQREFLRVTHVPLDKNTLPSLTAMDRALGALRRADASGGPVVVHSSAGIGRTGLVLAAWIRARHGLSVGAALAHVRDHARHFGANRNALEMGDQALALLESVQGLR